MKKLLYVILSLVMAFSLCACGQKSPTSTNSNNVNKDKLFGPSDEDWEIIIKYEEAISALKAYEDTGHIPSYQDGETVLCDNEAWARYYQDIVDAECVEKWLNEPYLQESSVVYSRQEILENIVIIEDVLLTQYITVTDELGNIDERKDYYHYGENGDVASITTNHDNGYAWPFASIKWCIENELNYSAQGELKYLYEDNRLSKIEYWVGREIERAIIPTYDDNGIRIKDTIKGNEIGWKDREYSYTYDSEGRLISVIAKTPWNGYGELIEREAYRCSYDNEGNTIESTFESVSHIFKYENDFKTCVIRTTCESSPWVNSETTASFDEEGRVVTLQKEFDDGGSRSYELEYGDYYIYKPSVEE